MNLLEELTKELEKNGKTTKDVKWIGSWDGKYAIQWEQFVSIANHEYGADLDRLDPAADLVVVGDYWWLHRTGLFSDYWFFHEMPHVREGLSFDEVFILNDEALEKIRMKLRRRGTSLEEINNMPK